MADPYSKWYDAVDYYQAHQLSHKAQIDEIRRRIDRKLRILNAMFSQVLKPDAVQSGRDKLGE